MKERPILMNPASLQGLLDNRKRQTRRVIKPQPFFADGDYIWFYGEDGHLIQNQILSPYGQPGDRLWVRETWRPLCRCNKPGLAAVLVEYRAGGRCWLPCGAEQLQQAPWWKACADPWRPSIFMPRWASRALLEITGIRAECLQDISFEDCLAEGIISTPFWGQDVDLAAIQADTNRPMFIPSPLATRAATTLTKAGWITPGASTKCFGIPSTPSVALAGPPIPGFG